jgi:hypothetical protein
MGLLSDVFLASDAQVATLRPGDGGPKDRFPSVPGKGIDPVKLARLGAVLTRYQGDIMALVKAWDDERHLVYAGDEEVIYRFSEALSTALAQLPPEAISSCVEAWAATEEWRLDGADTPEGRDSLRQWLSAVCELARRGQREGRSLCIWWCL